MLFVARGVPDHIRSDNGSEFTATTVRDWLSRVGDRSRHGGRSLDSRGAVFCPFR